MHASAHTSEDARTAKTGAISMLGAKDGARRAHCSASAGAVRRPGGYCVLLMVSTSEPTCESRRSGAGSRLGMTEAPGRWAAHAHLSRLLPRRRRHRRPA